MEWSLRWGKHEGQWANMVRLLGALETHTYDEKATYEACKNTCVESLATRGF